MPELKTHIKIALLYFLLAASLGVVLRFFPIAEISVDYKFMVHTHSHIALLGWVYLALTTLLYKLFVQSQIAHKKYARIFWFTQFTLIGMLFTFPFTGYALFSIVFSTLFLLASYWFFWFFRKYAKPEFKKTHAYTCVNAALWYLVLSSLGPWALGAIMNTLGAESIWYRLAIYFYLHFLYNGWMTMALVGILFYAMQQQKIRVSQKTFESFYWSINLGIAFSFFLSTLFANPPISFNVLGGVGAVLQLGAICILWRVFVTEKVKNHYATFQNGLLKTIAFLLVVKMLLQLVTALPYFANLAATHLDFTIGYLHWTFLGVISIGLFLFLDFYKMIYIPKNAYFLYLTGFFITEALIFYRGLAVWRHWALFEDYFAVLAWVSVLIPAALIFFVVSNVKRKQKER